MTEWKENEDYISDKTEEILDLDTSGKDLESTQKPEDVARTINSDEDGVVPEENVPGAFEKFSEENEGYLVEKESISKEESGKEGDRTYNLQLDAEERSSLVEQDMQFRMSNLR